MLKFCHLLLYAELASLVLEHLHVVLRHGVLPGALKKSFISIFISIIIYLPQVA